MLNKLLNRLIYWFKVRRYHVDGLRIERFSDGSMHLFAEHKGEKVKLTGMGGACDGDGITDYGIYMAIKRSLEAPK